MPHAKKFKLAAEQMKSLVPSMGGCIATDRITVDGARVGYMYREWADHGQDGGWRFLAGDETQDYMDDAANHGIYAPNTVANYDPAIIPYLDAGIGAAFELDKKRNVYVKLREAWTRDQFEFPDDADGDALRSLSNDADFGRQMAVDFSVIFRDEQLASAFLKFMENRAMVANCKLTQRDEADANGFDWVATVTYFMFVSYDSLIYEQRDLAKHAQTYGGELDGWGSFGNLENT